MILHPDPVYNDAYLGFTAGVLRPKMYETSMKILIPESAKHNPFLEDLAIETRVSDRISALAALLHSRHVLISVARDLELIDAESPIEDVDFVISDLSKQLKVRLIGEELVELRYTQNSTDDSKILSPLRSALWKRSWHRNVRRSPAHRSFWKSRL